MGRENIVLIAAAEAKEAAAGETTLAGRLRAAMASTAQAWLTTDDDERFQAALVAAIELSPEEDRAQILKEHSMLKALASGNGAELLALADDDFKPIGLLKMWRDATGEGER